MGVGDIGRCNAVGMMWGGGSMEGQAGTCDVLALNSNVCGCHGISSIRCMAEMNDICQCQVSMAY
jgi:hypothetical protein